MKRKKVLTFYAREDVIKIYCGVYNANVNIVTANTHKLYIEYSKNLSSYFEEGDGLVTVRQHKKPLWKVMRRPTITIYIPECCVPDLTVAMNAGTLKIEGGIYNDAEVRGLKVVADIEGATFENLRLDTENLKASANRITVKKYMSAMTTEGSLEFNNIFCKTVSCNTRKGNIGISGLTCDFAILYSDAGNIAASVHGNEADYTIDLQGTTVSGKENVADTGKVITARVVKGHVVLDFDGNREPADNEKSANKTDAADKTKIYKRKKAHA